MSVDLLRIHQRTSEKKAGTKELVPASSWLVARIKSCRCSSRLRRMHSREPALSLPKGRLSPHESFRLRGSSRPHRQIPQLSQDTRHLHPVQLRNKRQNLRDELIFHQFADFVLAVLFSATEQF